MPSRRSIATDYENVSQWLPYYESRGDERGLRVARLHQSQIALEMIRRFQARDYHSQSDSLNLYKLFDPTVLDRGRVQLDQTRAIRRAQRKAVLYTSKTSARAPTGALFWTRQGRIDIGLEETPGGDNRLSLYAGGLALLKSFSRGRDIWASRAKNPYRVVLHSGTVASTVTRASTGLNFVPDKREVNLVVGAANIADWMETRPADDGYGYIADKLGAYAAKQPLSDAVPPDYDMSIHKSERTLWKERLAELDRRYEEQKACSNNALQTS